MKRPSQKLQLKDKKYNSKFPTRTVRALPKGYGQNLQFDRTTRTRKIFAIYSKLIIKNSWESYNKLT